MIWNLTQVLPIAKYGQGSANSKMGIRDSYKSLASFSELGLAGKTILSVTIRGWTGLKSVIVPTISGGGDALLLMSSIDQTIPVVNIRIAYC